MSLLPKDFIAAHRPSLITALGQPPTVSLRLNTDKVIAEPLFDHIAIQGVGWCDQGRLLSQRPCFTLDPRHAAGGYYVQEAGSMIVGAIVERLLSDSLIEPNPTIVDLCAAPGGKTTHLSSVVGDGGTIIANEVIRQRAGILAQNVTRWGKGNTVVTSVDASVFGSIGSLADVLVVDAPCSGEGMFRKDPSAALHWSVDSVAHSAARQRRILGDSVGTLRNGGYLIYSTCTFNQQENEKVIQWLVDSGDFEPQNHLLAQWGESSELGCHLYPDRVQAEGLFCSVLRYTAPSGRRSNNRPKQQKSRFSPFCTVPTTQIEHGGRLWAYSDGVCRAVDTLRIARVQMLMAGVELGQIIGGKLKPAHAFALYAHSTEIFASTELPLPIALDYLRRQNIPPDLLVEGLQAVTFAGLALGFAKRIDGRVNNLLPVSWRVLQ